MEADAPVDLDRLTAQLVAALRRDATALEQDRSADLDALEGLLGRLLDAVRAAPADRRRQRALLQALSEIEDFHRRIRTAHGATRTALLGAADRRSAALAYGEASRFARVGAGA